MFILGRTFLLYLLGVRFTICLVLVQNYLIVVFLNKYHLRFNTALRFSEDVLFVLECMSCCDYISVGE